MIRILSIVEDCIHGATIVAIFAATGPFRHHFNMSDVLLNTTLILGFHAILSIALWVWRIVLKANRGTEQMVNNPEEDA